MYQQHLKTWSKIGHTFNQNKILKICTAPVKWCIAIIAATWITLGLITAPIVYAIALLFKFNFSNYMDDVVFYPIHYRGTSVKPTENFQHIFDWALNS